MASAAALGDDGGTCNLDAVCFHFDRSPSVKVRHQYEAALGACGFTSFWTTGVFGKGKNRRLVFGPGCGGQGNSRARAARAFATYLHGLGYDVTGWYQMD